MGSYQWTLVSLCGFGALYLLLGAIIHAHTNYIGWMADNVGTVEHNLITLSILPQMWLQAVAIILPRVQHHYSGKHFLKPLRNHLDFCVQSPTATSALSLRHYSPA